MASSALATQRCFCSELRHRSTLAVYAPSCDKSDSMQFVVFRLISEAPIRPPRQTHWRFHTFVAKRLTIIVSETN